MRKDIDMFIVQATDNIRTAMLKITANKHRVVVVMDGSKVVGTVSDGDIRRAFLKELLPIAPVEKIMNINCRTTTERDPQKLTEIIHREKVTVLPVVNEDNELLDVALAYEPLFVDE
ncbi:CBS domain-containing protein [Desulfobacterota bacterium AH_259_B03_O07]|nr:CBS domain-containing protein [Desulfobacterota bacterium AH_259_B03_O07]